MLAGLGRFVPPGARQWLRRSLSPPSDPVPSPRRRPRAAGDRRLHVHIGVNFFGAGNLGDDLMLAGFLAALGARADRLALTCCTPFDLASQRRRFPAITWLADDPLTRAQALADADLWLALGDTPFQLLSGPWMRDHLAAQIDAVARHALPMFYLGIGTEGDEVLADPLFRALAAGADHIWCRDAASARRLAPHAFAAVATGADLCHAYLGQPRPAAPDRNGMAAADLGLVLAFESPDRFEPSAVRRAIDGVRTPVWLVQEVRALAGGERHGWSRLDRATRRRLTVATPDYADAADVETLLAAWPRCVTVAASRYHALCINAWRGSRLVAVQRSGKIGGIAEDFELPHAELALLADALPDARAAAPQRLDALAASTRAMVDDFCRVVGVAPVAAVRRRGPAAPRIAVVKLDGLGDFVLATPFLRAVRTIWPDSPVTVVVRPAAAALARLCPYVTRVVVVDLADPDALDDAFDLVFVPRPAHDYFGGVGVAARLPAGARWGFAGTASNDTGLTHLVPIPAADSHARLNLQLLWAFTREALDDRLEVWPSAEARQRWQTRFAGQRARQPRPLCLLGIGAGHAWKCWPAARWADVAAHLRDVHGLVPVIVGAPGEAALAEAVLARDQGVVSAIGASIDDLCALATLARLFVGNDSGPKHVAAASGARVVELNAIAPDDPTMAESQPIYFRPHGVPHEVLQPEAGFTRAAVLEGATIRSIGVARVLHAIDRVLAAPDWTSAPDAGNKSPHSTGSSPGGL